LPNFLLRLENANLSRTECPPIQAVADLLSDSHSPVGLGGVRDLEEGLVLVGIKLLASGVILLQSVPLKHLQRT